jgi:hypothetical protein
MRAIIRDDASHTHLRGAFEQCFGNDGIRLGHGVQGAGDGQNTVVHTLHRLAHTGLDTGLFAQVGHILPAFADDDACLFGRYDGAERQLRLRIFLLRTGHISFRLAVDCIPRFGDSYAAETVRDVTEIIAGGDDFGSHGFKDAGWSGTCRSFKARVESGLGESSFDF